MEFKAWLYKTVHTHYLDLLHIRWLHTFISRRRLLRCAKRGCKYKTLRYDAHLQPVYRRCMRCRKSQRFDEFDFAWIDQ